MSKNNQSITIGDQSITYYGCASILDAIDLSGKLYSGDDTARLITVNEVLDLPETYGVELVEHTVVDYTDNQTVAYCDLTPYTNTVILPDLSNQKVGLLKYQIVETEGVDSTIQKSAKESSFRLSDSSIDTNWLNDGNASLLYGVMSLNNSLSSQEPGRINVYVNTASQACPNLDIIILDFLPQHDNLNLSIDKIALRDYYTGAEFSESTIYSPTVDTSDFYFNNYTTSVVRSGEQKLCALVNDGPFKVSLKEEYLNFSEYGTYMSLILIFDNPVINKTTKYRPISEIQVELEYLNTQGNPERTSLNIVIWISPTISVAPFISVEPGFDPVLPEDPENPSHSSTGYHIVYQTSDSTEIIPEDNDLLEELYNTLSPENPVVAHGYNQVGNYGYIHFEKPIEYLSGREVFAGKKNLTVIKVYKSLQTIAAESFLNCTNLQVFSCLSDKLDDIGAYAFANTGLLSMDLHLVKTKGIEIGDYAFYNCTLQNLSIGTRMNVHSSGFENCTSLRKVELNKNMVFPEGKRAFYNCHKLETDVLKWTDAWTIYEETGHYYDRLYTIGEEAFAYCSSLTEISLSGGCTNYAHWLWFTPPIVIPDSYPKAFAYCTNLKTIYIRGAYGVDGQNEGFCRNTFLGCQNVEKIYCHVGSRPVVYLGAGNIWKSKSINWEKCHLYIPKGCTAIYDNAPQWGDFRSDHIHELTLEEFEEVNYDFFKPDRSL